MGNSFTSLRNAWIPMIKAESPGKLQNFLIEYSNAVHVVDSSGRMILHDAAEFGTDAAISMICDHIREPNVLWCGQNALHIAIYHNRPLSIITTLVDRGVRMTTQDFSGNTPLHLVALANREDIVSAFAHRSTPLCIPRWDGLTPLDLAITHGHGQLGTLLLSAGSIPDSQIVWRVLHQIWIWDSGLYVNGERYVTTLPSDSRRRLENLVDFAHVAMDYFVANGRIIDPRAANPGIVAAINHPELNTVAREIQQRASQILRQEETVKNIIPPKCHIKRD